VAVAVFAYTAGAASHMPHKVLPEAAPSPVPPFNLSLLSRRHFLCSHLSPRPLSLASPSLARIGAPAPGEGAAAGGHLGAASQPRQPALHRAGPLLPPYLGLYLSLSSPYLSTCSTSCRSAHTTHLYPHTQPLFPARPPACVSRASRLTPSPSPLSRPRAPPLCPLSPTHPASLACLSAAVVYKQTNEPTNRPSACGRSWRCTCCAPDAATCWPSSRFVLPRPLSSPY